MIEDAIEDSFGREGAKRHLSVTVRQTRSNRGSGTEVTQSQRYPMAQESTAPIVEECAENYANPSHWTALGLQLLSFRQG